MRLGPLWTCALLALAGSTQAQTNSEALRADVRPAWEGHVLPGGWSELAVRVVSDRGGLVSVATDGGPFQSVVEGRVEADVPRVFRVPARAPASDLLRVSIRGPAEKLLQLEVPLQRIPAGERLVIAPPSLAESGRGPSRSRVAPLDVLAFPTTARGFEPVAALVIDPTSLARLADRQLRGLEQYLRGCGRLLAVGFSPSGLEGLRSLAGCHAGLLRSAPEVGPAAEELSLLLARPLPRLPASAELRALRSAVSEPGPVPPLFGFLAAYALVLALGSFVVRRAWLIASLPLAAAALLVVAFTSTSPQVSLLSWTEITSGTRSARFRALLGVVAWAPGEVRVDVPEPLGVPEAGPPGTPLEVRSRPDGPSSSSVLLRPALFSERLLSLRGALAWTAPVELTSLASRPRVNNPGPRPSEPGYLFWLGEVWALPALNPGEGWTPSGSQPLREPTLPRWVVSRAQRAEPAVLLSASPPLPALAPDASHRGWTLIRARP